LRGRGEAGAGQISRSVQVEIDSRIVQVNVSHPRRSGIHHETRALFFRSGKDLGEQCPIENHRMATAAVVARDHNRLARSMVRIDYRSERFGPDHRMISKMHDRARRIRSNNTEADLQRRQLPARIVRILDNLDTPVARNRGPNALTMRPDYNHEPRHDCEHRLCYLLDKGPRAYLEQRLRIAHPARLARRQDDPLELPLHSVDFRGRLPHRCELLRPFEDAGTYAEREIVTLAGATFANNLRDDRDRNFLGRLAADRDAKRRMHVAEPLDRNPALADSLERGLHPAARTDHPDESARLHQRRAHDFLVERMTARDGNQIAVAVERERVDRGLERFDDYFVGVRKPLTVRKRCAIVDHRNVKPDHRSKHAQRRRDMARADDYQPLRTNDRIDEQAHAAIGFEMRDRLKPAGAIDFEQGGNRVGRSLDDLRELRRGQIDRSRISRARIAGIDKRPRPGRHLASRTRIDHRYQCAGSTAAGGAGQLARDWQVAGRGPQIDEDVHYSAAGTDLGLVEIAGEIDLRKPRAAFAAFSK